MRCECLCAVLLLFSAHICFAQPPASPIPAAEIAALEQGLEQAVRGGSRIRIRMACKDLARQVSALLEASPEAPNRYAALAVLFGCQKTLLMWDTTEENRRAFFATCIRLSKAPDEYADARLEAELLLSQKELAEADAPVADRVRVLEEIMEKYRNTSAEQSCLTLALQLASEERAFDLEMKIEKRLAEGRFTGDHEIIASKPLANLNTVFSGRYQSADNVPVKFPSDRLGHQYLVIFWSTSNGHEEFLASIKEQQEQFPGRVKFHGHDRFPGRFEVYSFNLDEMPDAGKSILDKAGVKGTALHLPGGKRHSAYQAYARRDPVAILVDAQGHSALGPGQIPSLDMWLDDGRYTAQLRSLYIGEFLVGDQRLATSDQPLASEAKAIQDCFVVPPFRYRLTPKVELDGYRKAEKLCAAAIKKHSQAPDLWRLRNQRIIALIGMSNLAREPKYLAQAVEEAKAMLATELPPGADVVARFCLVKHALWGEGAMPEALLSDFIDAEGGEKAPAPERVAHGAGQAPARVLATAVVLAIEANAGDLYQDYRERLLSLNDQDHPDLWPVLSLIRDRHHNHRLFWGYPGRWGYSESQRYRFRYVPSGVTTPEKPNRVVAATLKDLDGRDVRLPQELAGKMSGIVFVEPPEDAAGRDVLIGLTKGFAGQFSSRGLPVIVAFLSEDAGIVKSMIKDSGGSFRAAMVPGGLKNPLVRRLGILSADRIPNPFLLHGEGTIAWWMSGLDYTVARTPMPGAVSAAIGINIEKVRADRMFQPLEQGDYKRAVSLLSGRGLPPYWDADRLQGRALAHMGLKDWEAALTDINAAIASRESASRHKKAMSLGEAEMHFAKATILKKLGRPGEAGEERMSAEQSFAWLKRQRPTSGQTEKPPSYARNGVPVGVFDDMLRRVRLALPGEGK